MRHRNYSEFLGTDLVDDAIGEPTQQITAAGTPKYRANLWVDHDRAYPALKLRDEGKAQFDVGARCVEGGCILQFR
jgi:hypothetical protein